MATLAADKQRNIELGEHNDVGVIASDIIYEGAAVGDNASGYARPLVGGDTFLGFAVQRADNASGSAGDINVRLRQNGQVQLSVSGAVITDIGKAVYASDDDTFTFTETGNSYIGRVKRFVSSGVVVVEFDASRGGLAMTPHAASALAQVDASQAGTFNGTLSPTVTGTQVGAAFNHLAIRLARLEKMLTD